MVILRTQSAMARSGAATLIAATLLAAVPAIAQGTVPSASATHAADIARLNDALRTLARTPQSLDALIAAGEASLKLEDVNGALGFFRRAETTSSQDPRVKAGLGSVLVRQRRPLEALRLFTDAALAGALSLGHVGDRGLAYDLIGDNTRAQQDYAVALSAGPDPVISRRLALSQAIAGNQGASDVTLLPLLQHQDLAAYRTRAFALAIRGRGEEAVSIAETMLPTSLSGRMAPYLRYMPRLTRAQQAAAANLGAFPRPEEIGRDDPALVAYAASIGVPTGMPASARAADARLAPSGVPMGRTPLPTPAAPPQVALAPIRVRAAIAPPIVSTPAPQLAPVPAPVPASRQVVALAAPPATVVKAAPAAPAPPEPARTLLEQPREPVTPALATPSSENSLARVTASQQNAPASAPGPSLALREPTTPPSAPVVVARLEPSVAIPDAPAPVPVVVARLEVPAEGPPAPRAVSLNEAFADFAAPQAPPPVAAPGAVDVAALQRTRAAATAKPAAKPAALPKPPPVPSRQWVQVATGRDPKALAFDWKRLKREAGTLLDRQSPSLADWGQTNRLVVGPFATTAAADALIGKLKDKKINAFRFTSAVGEAVTSLN